MKRSMRDYTLADVPEIGTSRSRFNTMPTHTTTFSQGEIVPLLTKEILPGDSFSVDMASLIRMSTPVFPVMDNCVFDVFAFWVPNRLVWEHWKNFIGENTSGPWAPNVEYTIPQLKFDTVVDAVNNIYGADKGSLANHMYHVGPSLPAGDSFSLSDLPNRGMRLIWNEFFRSEAYQNPLFVPTDDSDRSYGVSYDVDEYAKTVFRANRLPDYFSLALPAPNNGAAVSIPVSGLAPVLTGTDYQVSASAPGLHVAVPGSSTPPTGSLGTNNGNVKNYTSSFNAGDAIAPTNLYANLAEITGNLATINELRTAFQINKLMQRYQMGRRYREVLANVFNVNIPDTTVQVPEYLGGCEFDINMSQVVQTSSTDSTSPQGNVSAYSMTVNKSHLFTKSFVEHGVLHILGVARVRHTYANSVDCSWRRKRLLDFFMPQLANISDQPILVGEFCPFGDTSLDETVFGYKEAWSEYRIDLNSVSGEFSPDNNGSSLLSAYTYADYNYFAGPLVASPTWLLEPNTNISQTLAVPSEPDFIANFCFHIDKVRPIPVHSIPGLADHH